MQSEAERSYLMAACPEPAVTVGSFLDHYQRTRRQWSQTVILTYFLPGYAIMNVENCHFFKNRSYKKIKFRFSSAQIFRFFLIRIVLFGHRISLSQIRRNGPLKADDLLILSQDTPSLPGYNYCWCCHFSALRFDPCLRFSCFFSPINSFFSEALL